MTKDLRKKVTERKVVRKGIERPQKKAQKAPKKPVSPLPSGILSKQEFRAMEDGMQTDPARPKRKRDSTRLTDQDDNEKEGLEAVKSLSAVMKDLYAPFYGGLYPDKIHNKKMVTYLGRITRAVRGLKEVAVTLEKKKERTIEAFIAHFNKDIPLQAEKLRLALNGLDEEIAKHAA